MENVAETMRKGMLTFTIDPPPEPRIGPGMIIERGRERIRVIMEEQTELWKCHVWRRMFLSSEWFQDFGCSFYSTEHLEKMMKRGRVIRPADEPRGEDK